jgi:phosphohistidine phosphatase
MRDSGIAVSALIASPFVRAQQTADCIDQVYGGLPRQTCEQLVPDANPQALFDWLLANPPADNAVLVSHMPLVAQLTASWTGSVERIGFNVGTVVVTQPWRGRFWPLIRKTLPLITRCVPFADRRWSGCLRLP